MSTRKVGERGMGNTGTLGNLNTGAAAARRVTLDSGSGKMKVQNLSGSVVVWYLAGAAAVDLTDLADADGFIPVTADPTIIAVGLDHDDNAAVAVSFFAASDVAAHLVYSEVE